MKTEPFRHSSPPTSLMKWMGKSPLPIKLLLLFITLLSCKRRDEAFQGMELAMLAGMQNTGRPGISVPVAPVDLQATAGDSQVSLSWTPMAGAVSYNVYWEKSPGVTRTNGFRIKEAASPFVHSGLANGTDYHYTVTALNPAGESIESAEAKATPMPGLPNVPAGLTASAGNREATLSWSPVAGAISYNIYWGTAPGITKTNGTKIAGAASPYIHNGLVNGNTYYYRVTSVNASGESALSGEASGTLYLPGSLDPSFGTGGQVTTGIGPGWEHASDMAIQSDGKIIVVGSTADASMIKDFGLARFNADGSLDFSFGTGGKVNTVISAGNDAAFAVALQTNGMILLAGETFNGTNYDFALLRYNQNGTLDTSFGTGGKVITAIGAGNDTARSVAIGPNGTIIVGGHSHNGTDYDFAVIRYLPDGSLDPGFGTGGKVTTDIAAGQEVSYSLALQTDGKMVLAGTIGPTASTDLALVRYLANGSLDLTFGTGGKVTTTIGTGPDTSYDVAIQTDGKIIAAGGTVNGINQYDFALIRYNQNGTLDAGFGSGGIVITDLLGWGGAYDSATDVAVQPDGKIIAAGTSTNGTPYFALARYSPIGMLDTEFGDNGRVIGPPVGYIQALAIQPDGKIVAAGGDYADFVLARYHP